MRCKTIAEQLLSNLLPIADIPEQYGKGVYILCLRHGAKIPNITEDRDDILYVGMTDVDLSARNHITYHHSGNSSPRRSLGALLREELKLIVTYRGSGRAKIDFTNYRFTDDSEKCLTEWMRDNLLASQIPVVDDVDTLKGELILLLKPCLNLTKLSGWKNPQKPKIMAARSECAALARNS